MVRLLIKISQFFSLHTDSLVICFPFQNHLNISSFHYFMPFLVRNRYWPSRHSFSAAPPSPLPHLSQFDFSDYLWWHILTSSNRQKINRRITWIMKTEICADFYQTENWLLILIFNYEPTYTSPLYSTINVRYFLFCFPFLSNGNGIHNQMGKGITTVITATMEKRPNTWAQV